MTDQQTFEEKTAALIKQTIGFDEWELDKVKLLKAIVQLAKKEAKQCKTRLDSLIEDEKKKMVDDIKEEMYQMSPIRKITIGTETLDVLTKYQFASLLNCYPHTSISELMCSCGHWKVMHFFGIEKHCKETGCKCERFRSES